MEKGREEIRTLLGSIKALAIESNSLLLLLHFLKHLIMSSFFYGPITGGETKRRRVFELELFGPEATSVGPSPISNVER